MARRGRVFAVADTFIAFADHGWDLLFWRGHLLWWGHLLFTPGIDATYRLEVHIAEKREGVLIVVPEIETVELDDRILLQVPRDFRFHVTAVKILGTLAQAEREILEGGAAGVGHDRFVLGVHWCDGY